MSAWLARRVSIWTRRRAGELLVCYCRQTKEKRQQRGSERVDLPGQLSWSGSSRTWPETLPRFRHRTAKRPAATASFSVLRRTERRRRNVNGNGKWNASRDPRHQRDGTNEEAPAEVGQGGAARKHA